MQNAIILVFDRLGSGWLGPYGNTWVDTPAWNRLAAESMLAEVALIDSPDLNTVYHSYWQGRHALSERHGQDVPFLANQLSAHGVQSWLVTDEPTVAEHAGSDDFQRRTILPPANPDQGITAVEDSHCARLFATLLEVLEQAQPPFIVWVHAQAMHGPWDAPYALRCQFAEEDDPEPPEFVAPPDCQLSENYDPDELLGMLHAYAGQVAVLDICLGILLEALWNCPVGDSTALVATSSRGYPIGEHRYVGQANPTLYAELIQVPWLMHLPKDDTHSRRSHELVQPPDLYPTLLNWFGSPLPESAIWGNSLLPGENRIQQNPPGNQACSAHGDQLVMRVPIRSLFQHHKDRNELFVKPDDRWEVNEISDRCDETMDEMRLVLAKFEEAARADKRHDVMDLPSSLLDTLE